MATVACSKACESWLRKLIDTTQDAVVSIDRGARIVLFNGAAEKMFAYTSAEVTGQKVNVLMAEPYASDHDNYIARYERTGERRAIGTIRAVMGRRKRNLDLRRSGIRRQRDCRSARHRSWHSEGHRYIRAIQNYQSVGNRPGPGYWTANRLSPQRLFV